MTDEELIEAMLIAFEAEICADGDPQSGMRAALAVARPVILKEASPIAACAACSPW